MIEIQKNRRETIRISESEYEGHKFIDLRIWYDDNGEMKPKKKVYHSILILQKKLSKEY